MRLPEFESSEAAAGWAKVKSMIKSVRWRRRILGRLDNRVKNHEIRDLTLWEIFSENRPGQKTSGACGPKIPPSTSSALHPNVIGEANDSRAVRPP